MLKRIKFKKQKPEINEWLFPKTTTILVSGKAGVGKTTVANNLRNYLDAEQITPYALVVPFALGVKEVAKSMGWDSKKDTRGRKLLQDIGNLGREYNENAWVDYLMDYIGNNLPQEMIDIIIIDDWRFPNESDYFLNRPELYTTFMINVQSPKREVLKGTSYYKDVSETSLDGYNKFNYIIENHGTLEDLETKSVNVLYDIIEESKKGGKP